MATQGLLITLCYIFMLTFICFPGLSDDSYFDFLRTVHNEANWYNLICLFIFNVFDLCGRYIGGCPCADINRKTVILLSVLRTFFIATFLLIAFETIPSWLFKSDWFKVLNYALFSFSNGYTGTLCAMKAP